MDLEARVLPALTVLPYDAEAARVYGEIDGQLHRLRLPLADADLQIAVRRVGFAQDDLAKAIEHLPEAVLDWRVPPSAVRIDNIFPDVRSIRDMLGHVASAMSFHIRGVGDVATRVPAPEGTPDLATARDLTIARLRALTDEERSGRVYKLSGPRGESEWTARKAIRRIINHQRFHAREIEQRLCWLTLGIPEVMPVSRE